MQVPGPFEYERATSVDHAIGLLDRLGDGALIVAGGHSLLPMMKLRIANPEYLVDINDLAAELGYIASTDAVRIGAMARHRQVLESDALAAVCPIFRDAERVIADPVVRNRGTVGGSLCQADPAEDLTTVCTVLDAVCLARGPAGEREVPIDDFLAGPTKHRWRTTRFSSRSGSRCAQQLQCVCQGGTPGRGLGRHRGGRRCHTRRRRDRRCPGGADRGQRRCRRTAGVATSLVGRNGHRGDSSPRPAGAPRRPANRSPTCAAAPNTSGTSPPN